MKIIKWEVVFTDLFLLMKIIKWEVVFTDLHKMVLEFKDDTNF